MSESEFSEESIAKYQAAGVAARAALDFVKGLCLPGARVFEICSQGDTEIINAVRRCNIETPAGSRVSRGISFPTCVSINNQYGNFSPSADAKVVLHEGDICKIELGAHIDGFVSIVGETVVCGAPADGVSDAAGRAIQAAIVAAHAALHLLRPGVTNAQLTEVLHNVAENFGVVPVKKLVSHEVKRYVIDGRRQILMARPEPGDERLECGTFEFDEDQAYTIDVRMSTGSGELKFGAEPATVFKRQVDVQHALRSPAARAAFNDIKAHFPTFAFALRQLSEQRTARLGIKEMLAHSLLEPFDAAVDKRARAVVAAVRFTALITGGRTVLLSPIVAPTLPDGFTLAPHTQYVLGLDLNDHNIVYQSPPSTLSTSSTNTNANEMATD